MTRSLRIRGLPGQLQLGRESRTFSDEGPATWPYPQDLTDKSQGNLTGKKLVSRENGAGLYGSRRKLETDKKSRKIKTILPGKGEESDWSEMALKLCVLGGCQDNLAF